MRKLGDIEGRNLKIEYRFLEGAAATLDELAARSLCGLGPMSFHYGQAAF